MGNLGCGHFSEMAGDPATSEAAVPVTESGAFKKQNSDGEGDAMGLVGEGLGALTLPLVRPLGRDGRIRDSRRAAPWS